LAIVIDAGRDAMDAAASGTRCDRFQRHKVCGRMALFPLSLEFRRTGTKPAEGLGDRRVAYGKAVWSWRPDAGVKLLRSKLLRGDGGKKARSPRRARYKP